MANVTKYRNRGLRRIADNPIERLLQEAFDWPRWDDSDADWMPSADINETDGSYVVHLDLPGMDNKDVKISIKGDVMTVCGERKNELNTDEDKFHRYERAEGFFCRTFNLPVNVDPDKITATSKDGVLKIELPKTAKDQPDEITIDVK